MYCSDCGTVNPKNTQCCFKCGHDLERSEKEEKSEVDIALAARTGGVRYTSSPGTLTTRIVIVAGIAAIVVMIPIFFMTAQLKTALPVLTREGKPALEQDGAGLGLAPPERPEVIADDVRRKANAAKARVALEQHFAEVGGYPDSLDELSAQTLGFIPDPEVYIYESLDDAHDFRLEVYLRSAVVSGTDVVKEGDITKLVITGMGY